MTSEEIEKVCENHKDEYLKNDSKNPFLDGMIIQDRLSTLIKKSYSAERNIFYGEEIENMPTMTEKDVIELNRLGWHLDSEFNCFAKFT